MPVINPDCPECASGKGHNAPNPPVICPECHCDEGHYKHCLTGKVEPVMKPAAAYNRIINDAKVLVDAAVRSVNTVDYELLALMRVKLATTLDNLKMPESK